MKTHVYKKVACMVFDFSHVRARFVGGVRTDEMSTS
jgi:hypothetical protein